MKLANGGTYFEAKHFSQFILRCQLVWRIRVDFILPVCPLKVYYGTIGKLL